MTEFKQKSLVMDFSCKSKMVGRLIRGILIVEYNGYVALALGIGDPFPLNVPL